MHLSKKLSKPDTHFLFIIVLIHPQPARQKKTAKMAVDTCYEVG